MEVVNQMARKYSAKGNKSRVACICFLQRDWFCHYE